MVFADLFSTSFLFSTAIIIILIGGIFAYVNYKMVEQDHKLSSMVSLVSILAQDLQFVKSKLHANTNANSNNAIDETNNLQYASQIMGGSDLISVSDDEEEKYDDEQEEQDGDEEQDDEEQDDEDEETYSDDESYEEEEEEEEDDKNKVEDSTNHIKLLNLTLANENFEVEDLSSPEHEDDIKIIHIENNLAEELMEEEPTTHIEVPPPTDTKISMDDINFLKSVTITDLGEIEDANSSKTDYKKMSINKLREIVVSKGLVTDASKLKKPEILNLLGDE